MTLVTPQRVDFDGDLSVAHALWKRGVAPSELLVDTATRALVDGLDTPSPREPAGVRVDDASYEAPALCEATLRELGWRSRMNGGHCGCLRAALSDGS